jgi:hypothetical protein
VAARELLEDLAATRAECLFRHPLLSPDLALVFIEAAVLRQDRQIDVDQRPASHPPARLHAA